LIGCILDGWVFVWVDMVGGNKAKFGLYMRSGGIFRGLVPTVLLGGCVYGVLRMEKMAGFGWREKGRMDNLGRG